MKEISYLKVLTLTTFCLTFSSRAISKDNQNVCTENFWRIAILEELAENISNPDQTCDGKWIIHLAAEHSSAEVFTELLKMGAYPDATDINRNTALMLAAERGHTPNRKNAYQLRYRR